MVRTLCFQRRTGRGPGFDPWSGNEDPASHMIRSKKKSGKLLEDIVMQMN